MADEKKGISVRIDAALHAEIRQFIEANGMTMADFVSQALYNELHPKIQPQEVKYMGPTRTMAFQMPEDMFQRLKDYLHRHNITQKEFVLGLVEAEIKRDEELINAQEHSETAEHTEEIREEQEITEDYDEEESEDESFDEDMDGNDEPDEDEEFCDDETEDEDIDDDMTASDESDIDEEPDDEEDECLDDEIESEESIDEESESEELSMAM